jgi:hypothetical protein
LSRTMWLALFCLVGLGPVIAIKVAAPPASSLVEPALDQSKTEPAFALNESAKSDRLELPRARAEAEIIVPAAKPTSAATPSASPETVTPAETPSTSPETVKEVADRHWQNANAKLIAVASPRRHPKSKEPKQSADNHSPSERKEVWHCRQDAVGSLLRSLDLSPRCNL